MYSMYVTSVDVHFETGAGTTEYTECWPCTIFDILLNKYFPAG